MSMLSTFASPPPLPTSLFSGLLVSFFSFNHHHANAVPANGIRWPRSTFDSDVTESPRTWCISHTLIDIRNSDLLPVCYSM